MSQVETNKAIIKLYFEAYNTKNEAIFDEIIAPDYIDHGQSYYMGSPGRGVAGARNDLKNSLDKSPRKGIPKNSSTDLSKRLGVGFLSVLSSMSIIRLQRLQ